MVWFKFVSLNLKSHQTLMSTVVEETVNIKVTVTHLQFVLFSYKQEVFPKYKEQKKPN